MTNPVTNPIPEHDPELVLYRFYDAEGGLIYVGKSVAFLDRLSQHRRDSGFFPLVASVTLERGFSTEGDLLAAALAATAAVGLAACSSPADVVSENISKEAENFGIARKVVLITWADGTLREIRATGPRRLKSGKLQDKGERHHAESREQEWRGRALDPDATKLSSSYDVPLPRVIADRIAAYELAVAVASSHPAPGAHK